MTHSFQCRSCHFSALHWNDTTPMHVRPIFTHVSFFIRYHVIFHPKNDIFHVSFFENWHFSYIIFPVSRHFSSEKWHFSYIIFRKMSFFIYHFSSGIKSFFIFHPVSRHFSFFIRYHVDTRETVPRNHAHGTRKLRLQWTHTQFPRTYLSDISWKELISALLVWMYAALLRICRAHLQICKALVQMSTSFHAHIYLIYPEKSLYQLFWCGCMRLFCGYAGLICRYVRLLCGCQPVSTHISIWYILKRAYISFFGVDVCGSFADMQGSFADM